MSEFVLLLHETLKFIIASQTPSDEESGFVLVENKCISYHFFQWQKCGSDLFHKEKLSLCQQNLNTHFASVWL